MQVILCDPYLSALEAFAKTCYTNRRYLYLYLYLLKYPLRRTPFYPVYSFSLQPLKIFAFMLIAVALQSSAIVIRCRLSWSWSSVTRVYCDKTAAAVIARFSLDPIASFLSVIRSMYMYTAELNSNVLVQFSSAQFGGWYSLRPPTKRWPVSVDSEWLVSGYTYS